MLTKKNNEGYTPLDCAVMLGKSDIVPLLVQSKANAIPFQMLPSHKNVVMVFSVGAATGVLWLLWRRVMKKKAALQKESLVIAPHKKEGVQEGPMP